MTGRAKMRFSSLLVALAVVTVLVAVLNRPETAAKVDQVFAVASEQVMRVSNDVDKSPVAAASIDPAVLQKVLDLAGWNSERLAALGDGQPLTDAQRDELLELLRRVRSFDAADIDSWAQPTPIDAIAANPNAHRGTFARLSGRVKRADTHRLPPDKSARLEMPTYTECDVELDGGAGRATVITARVPSAWSKSNVLDEPVTFEGLFVKLLPSDDEKPDAQFISREVKWSPTANSLLGWAGMDLGLLEFIEQRKPIRANERDAFFALLAASRKIGASQLARAAESQLPAIRRLWAAEAVQATADQSQQRLAQEVVARADTGKYSVAPLFNDPASEVGNLVVFDGLARRAVRIDVGTQADGRPSDAARQFGIDHYYELDVFTDDSQNNPIVFCVVELPTGFPLGESIREEVRVAGFFFKSWSFESRRVAVPQDDGQPSTAAAARQFAPLLVGSGPIWIRPSADADASDGAWVVAGICGAVLAGMWIAGWWIYRGDRELARKLQSDRYTLAPNESLNHLELAPTARAGLPEKSAPLAD